MLKRLKLYHVLLLLLLPVASLFFISGPSSSAMPWQHYAWNLGHIVFFCLATAAFHSYRPFRSKRSVLIYFAVVIAISGVIEAIQSQLGRSLSLLDVMRNIIGVGLALVVLARPFLPILLALLLAGGLAYDLTGFARTVWADYTIQTRAPIIEDFETPATFGYWQGDVALVTKPVKSGAHALLVNMSPKGARRAEFYPMLKDWRGYQQLAMWVYNPDNQRMRAIVRVDDELHKVSGYDHHDRFNQTVELAPGWNELVFSIDDIQQAPAQRDMDLSNMRRLIIFGIDLTEQKSMVIDEITLQ